MRIGRRSSIPRMSSAARGLGSLRGERKKMLDRAGSAPMWRCKFPRTHGHLGVFTICGGLAFKRGLESHLRDCHGIDALPSLVDQLFEPVEEDQEQRDGEAQFWCECGRRKTESASCCSVCSEIEKNERRMRVIPETSVEGRSEAAKMALAYRQEAREKGWCVCCRKVPADRPLLHCRGCLDAAKERKKRERLARTGE